MERYIGRRGARIRLNNAKWSLSIDSMDTYGCPRQALDPAEIAPSLRIAGRNAPARERLYFPCQALV